MKHFFTFLSLLALLLTVNVGWGQTTIFTETMGIGGSNGATIATWESNNYFDNDYLTMSGTGDMRNTSTSSGYTDASGTWNVMLNSTSEYFQIADIDSEDYTDLALSFGIRKGTIAEDGSTMTIAVSSNGTSWTNLTMPALPTGTGTTIWYYRTCSGSIPSTSTLYIRFTSTSTTEFRIDDVKLVGTLSVNVAPTLTTQSPSAISLTTVTANGNITNTGGVNPTTRGFCWDLASNADPDINDSKVEETGTFSTGAFTGSVSGLTANTEYKIRSFATNSEGTGYGSVITFKTLTNEPSLQSSAVNFSNVANNSFTINWTNGDGSNRIVLVKASGIVDSNPVDGASYTANTAFVSGTQIGTGNYVVYNSTSNTVDVTGLSGGTTYHVAVYEFNGTGGSENYLTTSPATGSQATTAPGWQISTVNTIFTIDFDNTVAGVNNGQFAGIGFTTAPAVGQLNSNAWAVTGWSDGSLDFGGTRTVSSDYTRGHSTGNVTTGGIYAFTVSTGNNTLGFQPGGSDWAPGTLTLRIQNQTGITVTNFHIGYLVYVRNDQGRSSSFNFSHSSDNITYSNVTDLNLTSIEAADGSPSWKAYYRVAKLAGLSIANEANYYLRWSGADVGGTGSRDEFALDNITLVANPLSNFSISGNFEEVVLSSTAESNIAASNTLTVSSTLTNSGTLTIKSDATGTGSLIHSNSGVSATVERYVVGHANAAADGWHLMGSPVATFDINGSSFDPGVNDDLYSWDEATNTWLNHKAGNPTQIVPGTGYLVAYESTATKSFTGNLNVSNVSVSGLTHNASQGKGWHLLGNPFASALEWNKTGGSWALTNIAATAKVWNSGSKAYDDIVANGIIPAAQGFFVQVNESTTGSLTIPAAARAHSGTAWYKSTTPRILLSASPADGSSKQESQIRIEPEATTGYDFYHDSRFLEGYAPKFYSVSGGEMLSTNALPQLQDGTSIPFGFVKNQHNAFVIRLEENMPATDIYLKDLKLNLAHHLSQQTEYYFTAAQGDEPNRFLLHFGVVGITEKPSKPALHAYVAAGQLHLLNLHGTAQLEIFDLSGRLLQQHKVVANGKQSVPLALPAGVYVVRATGETNSEAVKVIVQ